MQLLNLLFMLRAKVPDVKGDLKVFSYLLAGITKGTIRSRLFHIIIFPLLHSALMIQVQSTET